jgi:hypothetical protein
MPIDDFWLNLRTAARHLAPTVAVDSPRADSERLERALQSAALWLTPHSVEGYDPRDFAFLAPADIENLTRNVERFRAVAAQVPTGQPASEGRAREAWTALDEVLRLLRPHSFPDAESFKIQYSLEKELRGKLPPWVESFTSETGTDTSEDPALWIWLNVSDEAGKRLAAGEGRAVREEVESAVRRLGIRRWPYVRFQTPSELAGSKGS